MTNEEKLEIEQAAKQMADLTKAALARVMSVTMPDSYEGMIANVVAMRVLGDSAFQMLDDTGKAIATTVALAHKVAFGPVLEKLMAENPLPEEE